MLKKLGIIIQARTGSTRLPGKVLTSIDGVPLVLFLYSRITSNFQLPVIVATTDNPADNELVDLLYRNNISVYRGPEENVLKRFIDASNEFGFTDIIRVCSDNPFLEIKYLSGLIKDWNERSETDYLSYGLNNKPVILCHLGIFAEIVKLSALKRVANDFSDNQDYLEHVTNGVYLNREIFKINLINIDEEMSNYQDIRLTIDTPEDLIRVSKLIPIFKNKEFKEIAEYILTQPNLMYEMKSTILSQQK